MPILACLWEIQNSSVRSLKKHCKLALLKLSGLDWASMVPLFCPKCVRLYFFLKEIKTSFLFVQRIILQK